MKSAQNKKMFLAAILAYVVAAQKSAVATIIPDISNPLGQNVSGSIVFSQNSALEQTSITVKLYGLNPNSSHGWHVHVNPIKNKNCSTAGLHFNPMNATHGAPANDINHRHFGDLGNLVADLNGAVNLTVSDRFVSLYGNSSVEGLGIVIHQNIDDLGLGNATSSLTVGNSGR